LLRIAESDLVSLAYNFSTLADAHVAAGTNPANALKVACKAQVFFGSFYLNGQRFPSRTLTCH